MEAFGQRATADQPYIATAHVHAMQCKEKTLYPVYEERVTKYSDFSPASLSSFLRGACADGTLE